MTLIFIVLDQQKPLMGLFSATKFLFIFFGKNLKQLQYVYVLLQQIHKIGASGLQLIVTFFKSNGVKNGVISVLPLY